MIYLYLKKKFSIILVTIYYYIVGHSDCSYLLISNAELTNKRLNQRKTIAAKAYYWKENVYVYNPFLL